MPLRLRERVEADWLVLSVDGELDLYSAPALRVGVMAALERAMSHSGQGLLLDLEGAPFMDSAALGVVVGAYRRARTAGTAVRVSGASPQVSKLFDLTGLTTVLDLYHSVAAASQSNGHQRVGRVPLPGEARAGEGSQEGPIIRGSAGPGPSSGA